MIAPASRKLGRYAILQKLGRGGMADVYLAQDQALGYTLALKLIEHSPDADTCDSIEAERRGAVLQSHLAAIDSHVARIYDSGDVDGFFYVAMEYIDGQDLSELMRRGRLTPEFAADVAIAVADTLQNAHDLQVAIDGKDFHGIIHGDIKPKNIRIDARGEVRVLDFGIAKALSLSRRLTRNEFGSVPYGSPERLEAGEVNALSDLWSLGVMLYEMVTGLQPYHADTTERLERMIRSKIPPPPAPDPCPEPLRRIMVKAMAPDPAMRYQSARELADDLRAFRGGEEVRASFIDMDATRKTKRAAGPSDDTRRTAPDEHSTPGDETRRTGAHASVVQEEWPVSKSRAANPNAWLWRRIVLGTSAVVCGFLAYLAISSIVLYRRGSQLEREIAAEQVTDPEQIWTRWTAVSAANPSSWILHGVRNAVRKKLVSAASHAIDTYRNGDVVNESAWKGARDELARALALEPDDEVRGKLRITEGHIARINGMSHKDGALLKNAVAMFEDAQQLLPRSPDPDLGLARVYIYGLKDIDKGYQALHEAEKRGFALGNREKLQLADGYRDRADRVFWDSRNVRGLPQEKDQVQRAADDYKRSLELYQSIVPYGNASAGITRVQTSLESVNFRLQQIEEGNNSETHSSDSGSLRHVPSWLKPLIKIWR